MAVHLIRPAADVYKGLQQPTPSGPHYSILGRATTSPATPDTSQSVYGEYFGYGYPFSFTINPPGGGSINATFIVDSSGGYGHMSNWTDALGSNTTIEKAGSNWLMKVRNGGSVLDTLTATWVDYLTPPPTTASAWTAAGSTTLTKTGNGDPVQVGWDVYDMNDVTVSGTVTQIDVLIYCFNADAGGFEIGISKDGGQTWITHDDSAFSSAWYTASFTGLSWTQTDINNLLVMVVATGGQDEGSTFWIMYANVTDGGAGVAKKKGSPFLSFQT